MPPLHPPKHQLDVSPPKWSEVVKTVCQERAASFPGLTGVPYKLHKYAPDVLRFLWQLMRVIGLKQTIPTAWQRAGSILITKEKNSTDISQFCQISLLKVESKIFFSVVVRWLTTYLEMNHYIDTSVQKAGMPGFPGCVEHLSMIWHQVQAAKRDGRALHVVFLDLANAFGSVPHSVVWTAFSYFNVPEAVTALVRAYFSDVQICVSTKSMPRLGNN